MVYSRVTTSCRADRCLGGAWNDQQTFSDWVLLDIAPGGWLMGQPDAAGVGVGDDVVVGGYVRVWYVEIAHYFLLASPLTSRSRS